MGFRGSRNSIILYTVFTAVIHLAFGIYQFEGFLGKAWVLNGIGYLALMYALLWTPAVLQGQESLIRWAYLAFATSTIVLYFVFNGASGLTKPIGLITKFDEVLLLVSLWRYPS